MTSRVSFPKLIIETLRRHIAAVLITVLTFVIHIISFFLRVQNTLTTFYIEDVVSSSYPKAEYIDDIKRELLELSSPSLLNGVIAMLIGLFLAFDFFRYMHSKRETDFYDSMPVRKQTWFFTLATAGFGIFFLLSTITTGIEMAILAGTNFVTGAMIQNMLWNLLCMTGAFWVSWVTTVLAMVLTGHPIVAFLGIGVLSTYIPLIIAFLIPTYAGKYFDTYVYKDISSNYFYFSPITLVYKTTHYWRQWNIDEHWNYILGCFIFAIVIGTVSYLLFLRRPSETAGRAMAFEKTNFLIRFLLVIPLSLYAGLFLSEMSSSSSTAWLIFGVIFAAFLLHGIMECIFQFDIKALITKKRQLLIAIIFCLGFIFVFWIDLFGYDKYIPDANDLKAVKIDTYLFDPSSNDLEDLDDGLTGEYVDDALAVIKDIQKHSDYSDNETYKYMNDFTVTYHLKNGVERQRRYSYYGDAFPESLDKLYATEEFKNDYCVLYHLEQSEIDVIGVNNGVEYRELNLSSKELQEFYKIYLTEFTNMTFTEQLASPVVYKLKIKYPSNSKDHTISNSYQVYSCFENSLEFLKSHGAVTFTESENVKLTYLELYDGKYDYGGHPYINDETKLNELKQYMILSDYMYEYYTDKYIYCGLRYELNGSTNYTNVFIKESDVLKVLGQ